MQRITVSLDDELSRTLDDMVDQAGYQTRSEAVRDIVRGSVERWMQGLDDSLFCVGVLSYVYNRNIRTLAQRLSDIQHAHHNLVVATTLVHLDHDSSLESVMLKGPTAQVRALADQVCAERGVSFGTVNIIAVEPTDHHDNPGDHSHHDHSHLSPKLS